jgi:hypothetical protein
MTLGGRRGNATGGVGGGLGGHASDKALVGFMFVGDAAVRCCCGRGGGVTDDAGVMGRGSWAAAFEGDAVVWQAVFLGKRGAVQWTRWGLWAAALVGNVVMQQVVFWGGDSRGEGAVQQTTRAPAAALGG